MRLPRVAILTALCGSFVALAPSAGRAADVAPEAAAPQADVAPPARSIADARHRLDAARAEVTRLRGMISRKKQQLEAALNVSAEYRAALAERNRAKAAYEAARRPAVAQVRGTEQHRTASDRLAAARQSLSAATRTARLGAGEAIKLISTDVREAAAVLAAIETQAAAADPAAAQARAALDAAEEKLAALRTEHVDQALEADPACSSTRLRLASAETRLDAAGTELKRLRQAAAEADDTGVLASADDGTTRTSFGGPGLLPLHGNGTWTKAAPRPSGPICIGGA
jgi:chromosome segregation ATPase